MFTRLFITSVRGRANPAAPRSPVVQPRITRFQHLLASLIATLTTLTSLGIATYAAWHRAGLSVERLMTVALSAVAVLCVHLLPVAWRVLRVRGRVAAAALWVFSFGVVLFGQVSFFVVSQQHAGNERAALIPMRATPTTLNTLAGRTLTEIANDAAKLNADLAIVKARNCVGDCPTLKARSAIIAAKLAALNTEADEARRREAVEDRQNELIDREEAERATLRADPVASVVASWLHTTESFLELMLAVACAVVLEGAAIMGWLLVSVASGRAGGRDDDRAAAVSGRETAVANPDAVAHQSKIATADRGVLTAESLGAAAAQGATTTADDVSAVASEDERLLKKIHQAALCGELDPTQDSIRKLLRCRQPKAGRLNRLYQERFGGVQNRRAA